MRTFIVATDFSENARHASRYAVQLAARLDARVLLMHSYEAPVAISEYEVSSLHFDMMKEHIREELEESKRALVEEFGGQVPVDTVMVVDDLTGNLRKLYEDPEAKLAVVGLTGSGRRNFLLGSNTVAIVRSVGRVVLTVPPFAYFRPIRRVVFACRSGGIASAVPAARIKRIMELLDAELLVLQVARPGQPEAEVQAGAELLARTLEGVRCSFHTLRERNVVAGIREFCLREHADLVAIIPRRPDFPESLLKTNQTRAILFKSRIPILTLPPEKG
jgi:nucleotide-binding universal stress UspA family protein